MATEPKSWQEMSAEALREVAVLVLVFGLLDRYMFDHATSGDWAATIVLVAVATFVAGAVLERARRT
jgi:hypothetical protein